MGSKPKAPKPTKEEVALQQRQREESARLDDEENVRFKRILSGQLGNRRLLSSARRAGTGMRGATLAATPAASAAGGGASTGSGGGGRSSYGRMTMSKSVKRASLA